MAIVSHLCMQHAVRLWSVRLLPRQAWPYTYAHGTHASINHGVLEGGICTTLPAHLAMNGIRPAPARLAFGGVPSVAPSSASTSTSLLLRSY